MKKQSGFTLIEIMMSVIVFTVAILMSAGSIVFSSRIAQKVEAMREVQDEIRFLTEFVRREAQDASVIEVRKAFGSDDVNARDGDTLLITKKDGTKEYICPTPDSRGLEIVIESIDGTMSAPQTISTDKVMLSKFQISTVLADSSNSNYAFKIEMAAEEQTGDRYKAFNSAKISKIPGMSKPTKMELKFIVTNIKTY